jgi:hypothetical protein
LLPHHQDDRYDDDDDDDDDGGSKHTAADYQRINSEDSHLILAAVRISNLTYGHVCISAL